MTWFWRQCGEARQQRDQALLRVAQMEARLRDLTEEGERLRAALSASRQALERVIDNALFAAGAAPVFAPEDARFQPRPPVAQAAEAARAQPPLTGAEWRRRIERADAERAARDRQSRLREELRATAAVRRMETEQHPINRI